MTLHIGYALSSALLLGLFFVVLCAQLRARRLHPPLFWAVILATSTAGTTPSRGAAAHACRSTARTGEPSPPRTRSGSAMSS